jgi:hypothetical protein
METLNIPTLTYLPRELVDMIADYHDYEKYCKPEHAEKLQEVINNIGDLAALLDTENNNICPNIAWQCWGPGAKYLYWSDELDEDHYEEYWNNLEQHLELISTDDWYNSDHENDSDIDEEVDPEYQGYQIYYDN